MLQKSFKPANRLEACPLTVTFYWLNTIIHTCSWIHGQENNKSRVIIYLLFLFLLVGGSIGGNDTAVLNGMVPGGIGGIARIEFADLPVDVERADEPTFIVFRLK